MFTAAILQVYTQYNPFRCYVDICWTLNSWKNAYSVKYSTVCISTSPYAIWSQSYCYLMVVGFLAVFYLLKSDNFTNLHTHVPDQRDMMFLCTEDQKLAVERIWHEWANEWIVIILFLYFVWNSENMISFNRLCVHTVYYYSDK